MSSNSSIIRIKGENVAVPSIIVNERNIICRPGWLKIAEVQDEAFVEGEILGRPNDAVVALKSWAARPDILTFSQKFTETDKEYPFHKEWDDFAVIPVSTYDHWRSKQIKKDVKENLRRALNREALEVRPVEYTHEFVKGIKQLYDETPIRQGKKFWHYDKPLEKIEEVHGTYKERAEYIGAYFENELIGFLKMVYTDDYAKTMHVISNSKYHRKRPTNALIAKAVEICAQKKVNYFVYGEYNFIGKANSSLQEFKRRNGFLEHKYPRYFVPLTLKGKMALKLGVHYEWKRLVPNPIKTLFLKTRALFATQ